MLRLLVFPGTLLNMVESLHAGERPTFSLFLGMAPSDLGDLGGWGAILDAGAGGEQGSKVGLNDHLPAVPTSIGPEALCEDPPPICKPSKEQGYLSTDCNA